MNRFHPMKAVALVCVCAKIECQKKERKKQKKTNDEAVDDVVFFLFVYLGRRSDEFIGELLDSISVDEPSVP